MEAHPAPDPHAASHAPLVRLAQLIGTLDARRQASEEIAGLIDELGRNGLDIEWERELYTEFHDRYTTARATLLGLNGDDAYAEAQLLRLEDLLQDDAWNAAEALLDNLRFLKQTFDGRRDAYENRIATWGKHIEDLSQRIREAWDASAPIHRERANLQRLEALLKQARRDLDEQKYQLVATSLDKLATEGDDDAAFAQLDETTEEIVEKTEEARTLARQADLLLLAAGDPKAHEPMQYTVLLRTPSEPGTHGINIQDSSTLVPQDRRAMSDGIEYLTAQIKAGVIRSFQARGPAPPAEAPPLEALPADAAPEDAAPEDAAPEDAAPEDAAPLRHFAAEPEDAAGITRPPDDANALIQDMGDLMYRLFVPEPMQRYLRETPCSLTITSNDLELPWELMYYDDNFLCLDRPVARMPMGRAFPRIVAQPQRSPRDFFRFLLIYADPGGNLPAARREVMAIQEALEADDVKQRVSVHVIEREQVTGRMLNDLLRQGTYNVIHYAGHASFNEQDADLSGLLLHSHEVYFAQKIRRLLQGHPLVFLNACESGQTANEEKAQEVSAYLQKPAEGLASAFVYGGALGCVGSLWPVYDQPAADFAIAFYRHVLEGHMIGEAMRRARLAIREQYQNQITWASYVLYGNPTFIL